MKTSFLIILVTVSSVAFAQIPDTSFHWECGFDSYLAGQLQSDSNFWDNKHALDLQVREAINGNYFGGGGGPYMIPVVVHVISPTGSAYGSEANPSYAQIASQIAALNAGFAKSYPGYNGQGHSPWAVNTEIQFCLATIPTGIDPDSQLDIEWTDENEPGVMRYEMPPADLIHEHNMLSEQNLLLNLTHPDATFFPFDMYVNVWLISEICDPNSASPCNNIYVNDDPTVIGYATLPAQPVNGLDGGVMRLNSFGDNTTGNTFPLHPSFNEGKIFIHEVGHFLDMLHTFHTFPGCTPYGTCCEGMDAAGTSGQGNGDDCDDVARGDRLCDTPPTTNQQFNFCQNTPPNTCAEQYAPYSAYGTFTPNVDDQIANYLSYSDDGCMNTFTMDQNDWMHEVIDPAGNMLYPDRNNLWQPANLISTGVSTNGCASCIFAAAQFTFFPELPCPNTLVAFTPLATFGCTGLTYEWTFQSGTPPSSTDFSESVTFPTSGTYLVTLEVTNDQNQSFFTEQLVTVTGNLPTATITNNYVATPVCDGSFQTIEISFVGTPPFTFEVSDGTTTYPGYSDATTLSFAVQVTFTNNTFTLSSMTSEDCVTGTLSGTATYDVVGCCPNQIADGDFENVDLTDCIPTPPFFTEFECSESISADHFFVTNPSAPNNTWREQLNLQNLGNALCIDGPVDQNGYNLTFPSPPNNAVVWSEPVTINAGSNYHFDFVIANDNGSGDPDLIFDVLVTDQTLSTIYYNQTFTVPDNLTFPNPGDFGNQNVQGWYQFHHTWIAGVSDQNAFLWIRQIEEFGADPFDYFIDEISFRSSSTATVVATSSDDQICAGETVQLNATGTPVGGSYLWSPANSLDDPNISNPLASPIITTNYNVVYTDVNECTAFDNVEIQVDFVEVNAGIDQIVCSGYTTSLSGSANVSNVSWSPSTFLSCTNCLNPTVISPTATTTYTLTGTGALGCTDEDVVTINVTPNPTAGAGDDHLICEGESVQLQATGGTTYSWFPSTGLSCTTCANPVSTPTATITYTLTAYANGCFDTDEVTVQVADDFIGNLDECCIPSDFDPSNSNNYFINTTSASALNLPSVISSANYVIINGEFTVDQDLTFEDCQNILMGPDAHMVVQSSNTLTIDNSHVKAGCGLLWGEIKILSGGELIIENNSIVQDGMYAVWSEQCGSVSITNSTLNKNYIHFRIFNCNGLYVPTLENAVFNCSGNLLPDNDGLHQPCIITERIMQIYHSSASSNMRVIIGDNGVQSNTFMNAANGIYCLNSDLEIYNNEFKLIRVYQSCIPNPAQGLGRAIETSTSGNNAFDLVVGGVAGNQENIFTDCKTSVYNSKYNLRFIGNEIHNTVGSTGTIMNPGSVAGVASVNCNNREIIISDNHPINVRSQAIHISNCTGINSSTEIHHNTIEVENTNTYDFGIKCEQPLLTTPSNIALYCNTIAGGRFGIHLNKMPGTRVHDNNVTVTNASSFKFGIQLDGCANVNAIDNTVNGSSTNVANTLGTSISVANSSGTTLQCNTVDRTNRGLFFTGSCGNSQILGNAMHRHFFGIRLENANVGPQGTNNGQSNGNRWLGPFSLGGESASAFNSQDNWYVKDDPLLITEPPQPYSINLFTTATSNYPCSVSNDPCDNNGEELLSGEEGELMIEYSEQVAEEGISEGFFEEEIEITAKKQLYSQLTDSTNLAESSAVLEEFKDTTEYNNTGILQAISDSLALIKDSLLPQSVVGELLVVNASIDPANLIEQNEKDVNEVYLTTLAAGIDTFNAGQTDVLWWIANQCPITGGPAVYQARAMLSLVSDSLAYDDENLCGIAARIKQEEIKQGKFQNQLENYSRIYPNPASRIAVLEYATNHEDDLIFSVYSVLGISVASFEIPSCMGVKSFEISHWLAGIYSYEIKSKSSGQVLSRGKFVIQK